MGSAFSAEPEKYSKFNDMSSDDLQYGGIDGDEPLIPNKSDGDKNRPSLAKPPSFRDQAQARAEKVVKRSNSLRDLFAVGQGDTETKDAILVEAELLQTELNQLCGTLKKQIIEIAETIEERREQAQFLNDVTSILVSSQIGSLEAERRQVMHSIDYLQKVEINLRIQMEDYKEDPVRFPTINIPTYQEVMDHVQDRLANEIVPSDMEFYEKQQRELARTKPKPRFEQQKRKRKMKKRRPPQAASAGMAATANGASPSSIGGAAVQISSSQTAKPWRETPQFAPSHGDIGHNVNNGSNGIAKNNGRGNGPIKSQADQTKPPKTQTPKKDGGVPAAAVRTGSV